MPVVVSQAPVGSEQSSWDTQVPGAAQVLLLRQTCPPEQSLLAVHATQTRSGRQTGVGAEQSEFDPQPGTTTSQAFVVWLHTTMPASEGGHWEFVTQATHIPDVPLTRQCGNCEKVVHCASVVHMPLFIGARHAFSVQVSPVGQSAFCRQATQIPVAVWQCGELGEVQSLSIAQVVDAGAMHAPMPVLPRLQSVPLGQFASVVQDGRQHPLSQT